jgi:Na+-transporting NADH:ubiquinone oxidoreductase subunit A
MYEIVYICFLFPSSKSSIYLLLMANTIKIKKGLNINLVGEAKKEISDIDAGRYAIKPTDFIGVFPRLLVKEGDAVNAGTPLFIDKYRENIIFTSPVSGVIEEIKRGDKRVLEEIRIKSGDKPEYEDFGKADPSKINREEIIEKLLKSGVWPVIRQRPYSIIANPAEMPKGIYVSGFDTSPLAPDFSMIVKESIAAFQSGIDVLAKIGGAPVKLGLPGGKNEFPQVSNTEITYFEGPHPAGNVGIQIHKTNPINKGDIVWVVNLQDVIIIGRLFTKGIYDSAVIVPLCGSEVKVPKYFKTFKGASVQSLTKNNLNESVLRIISGNVLTGTRIKPDGYLGFYHNQFTVIPEGNYYEFFGWALPGLNKFSFSKSFFSYLTPKRKYRLDTNFHGAERAYVMTGQYEQVFPMDIYPMQLIKACLAENIELMENLGIYEVDEEDFALVEFIDTSKTEIQSIIRKGLDLIRKEMS